MILVQACSELDLMWAIQDQWSSGYLFRVLESKMMVSGDMIFLSTDRSVRVAEQLALPTSDHGVVGSNPAGGEILPKPKRRFIAQSLSSSPFHRPEMTEILLKGRKTLTHPSILSTDLKTLIYITQQFTAIADPFHEQHYVIDTPTQNVWYV